MNWLTEPRRAWIYRIIGAVLVLLVAYDLVAAEDVAVWVGLAAAILGIGASGLATLNTTTHPKD